MKIQDLLSELKKINTDEITFLKLDISNFIEIRKQSGNIFNKNFSCEIELIWAKAAVETEMIITDLINLIEQKGISSLTNNDFKSLSITETRDGNVNLTNVVWENLLTEDEKNELLNHDLERESEIVETKLFFKKNSIKEIYIECNNFSASIDI